MEVRAKKSLGQHFLTDQDIARRIVDALQGTPALEVGPGMGVLTKYLIPQLAGQALEVTEQSPTVSPRLKAIEIDKESVAYLKKHFPELGEGLIEGDFLKMDLQGLFPGQFSIIGNFPYNISSQIFFKIIDNRDLVPEVVCMIQKEVAERIAEKPGTKTYGILSVFLQAWYDIEYLFTVGSGAFNPPPKVQSAVIRLTRNSRTELGCDEKLFKAVVKTAFGQRRKTLRNSLKPLLQKAGGSTPLTNRQINDTNRQTSDTIRSLSGVEGPVAEGPVFDLRPERLSVEDFIALTLQLQS
ncbi:MAG: ribosomal RNA small subunit methyltransferase A [Bacteroidales bacterium]|nr:ribosomal RNA small subunit methyltransferase A [Bacteroidales bacterium]